MSNSETATRTNSCSPDMFKSWYSDYYLHENEDSPIQSRKFLGDKIISSVKHLLNQQRAEEPNCSKEKLPLVTVLSIGAGKQVLEQEIEKSPQWQEISPWVLLVTLDIATLNQAQLLSSIASHIVADGSQVPFADDHFDLVYSNMAIDFMPEDAFSEVVRILKNDGTFLANLHHPNLIQIARSQMYEIKSTIHTCNQKLKHGGNSKVREKYAKRLTEALVEYRSAQFILNYFPQLVFENAKEIEDFVSGKFTVESLTVEEHQNRPHANGWFYVEVRGMKRKPVIQ